jgi:outer membrane protein assembly factor BamB
LSSKNKKYLIALVSLVTGLTLLASCISTGAASRGWAGISELNNTLIFASTSGKVYAVDSTTGTVNGSPISFVMASSGGLSCIPSCSGSSVAPIAIYGAPSTTGDLVIIGGNDGRVHAFQLSEGKLIGDERWIYPRQGTLGASIIGGLTIANDHVYLATADGTVYSLTVADGYKEWSHSIGKKIWSTPAVANGMVYIGSFDKNVYALDQNTGDQKWTYETKGAITAPPLVQNGIVYVGSYNRHLYALDATTGKLVWEFPATGATNGAHNWYWVAPVISGNTLYAPCLDGRVYVVDAKTGGFITSVSLGNPVSSEPVVVGDSVIVAATDLAKKISKVYSISTTDQQSRELTSLGEGIDAALFASQGIVYLHTTSDNFYGLNAQNGALQKFSLTASK